MVARIFKQQLHTQQNITQTQVALTGLTDLLSLVQDIETGARGFATTGQEAYLDPYESGQTQWPEQMTAVRNLLEFHDIPVALLDRLETLLHERSEASRAVVDTRRAHGLDATVQLIALGRGRVLMDEIRALVRELEQTMQKRQLHFLQMAHGTTRWTMGALAALSGLLLAWVGISYNLVRRELRKRQQAQQVQQRSAEMIADLYNHAPCGYHSLDEHGVFVEINDTELGWLGYTRDEVVGRLRFSELLTEDSRRRFSQTFPQFLQTGEVHDLEFELIRRDGRTLPVLLSATAIRDETGRFVKSRSVMMDRTERKRLEDERNHIFSMAPDLMAVADMNGYFRRLNPAWERTTGHPLDVLLSCPYMDFVHIDDRAATLREAEKLAAGEKVILFENRYRRRDGTYCWLSWMCAPDTATQTIFACARDVTEEKETRARIIALNEELRMNTARLESTNRELEAFSYSVSHDLRAPLRSIDGFSRVLLEDCAGQLDEEGKSHLQRIIRATGRMGELIDDLTKLSRVSRCECIVEELDLSALATLIVEQLRQRTPERIVDVQIEANLRDRADPRLLRIALENLFDNAWKFTGKQTSARITFNRSTAEGQTAYCVCDNGVGFEMAAADRLFGAFQRLHSEREFPGTGIGLATVQRVIHRHGGRIWAQSSPEAGARFFFTLS